MTLTNLLNDDDHGTRTSLPQSGSSFMPSLTSDQNITNTPFNLVSNLTNNTQAQQQPNLFETNIYTKQFTLFDANTTLNADISANTNTNNQRNSIEACIENAIENITDDFRNLCFCSYCLSCVDNLRTASCGIQQRFQLRTKTRSSPIYILSLLMGKVKAD